jgi:hypothetical protein
MKTATLILAALVSAVPLTWAAGVNTTPVPADTAYQVVERGANHQVWRKESYERLPNGKIVTHPHQYTELASGLNYLNNGRWTPTKERIEVYPGGAVARQGQHQVIFANNLNSYGAIDMQTPDGKRLRSNVLGLMYYDTATGEAVLIARLQDSEGKVVTDNQVLYPNAFEGLNADVRYTYTKSGLEQDVIVKENPASPEAYNMNPDTTELEVFTEFIDPPAARIRDMKKDGASLEADQEVCWGSVSLGRGKAFNLGTQESQTAVIKRYVTIQGRNYLLEKVPVKAIESALSKLPEQASNAKRLPMLASKNLQLPSAPKAAEEVKAMKLALGEMSDKGYVLDYVTVNASLTNYTFQGDTTYYVSGSLGIYGTTTIEGGTVLKFDANGGLSVNGAINCQTAPYRPAVLTAKDDDAVGETISGSTGTPAGYYGTSFSLTGYPVMPMQLHDLRISHTSSVISVGLGETTTNSLQNVQIYDVGYVINGYKAGNWKFQNLLIARVGTAVVNAYSASISGEHWTVDQASSICSGTSLCLTNSLLSSITNMGAWPFTSVNNVTNGSGSGVFQTVGGGAYYLATNSPYRNVGTTNIDPTLLTSLRTKTTWPPIAYTNVSFYSPTIYSPQAARDTNAAPDLGYHYDPLDYVFGGCDVYTNITFTAGTAVGWFELPNNGGAGYGFSVNNNCVATFNGTVQNPCVVARYDTVQEGGNGNWTDKGWLAGIISSGVYDTQNPSWLKCNFTHFIHLAGDPGHFRDYYTVLALKASNCELYGGFGGYILVGAFTNCLLDRVYFWQGNADSAYSWEGYREKFQNCTFHGGYFAVEHWEGAPYWQLFMSDCAFDGTTISFSPPNNGTPDWSWLNVDHNALYNTTFVQKADITTMPGANNLYPAGGFNWQSSWLGSYYLPSDSLLINQGSTTADQIGLYYFTTQTNQANEGISPVDIGYHYVAVDSSGNPVDSNGDGIPNYLDVIPLWQAADMYNLGTGILRVFIDVPANGAVLQ